MKPIYDHRGQTVAWLDGEHIYHLNGSHAAFLNGENVHGHRGQHLGIFRNGLFKDHSGGAIAFIQGAQGGPILPITAIPPISPITSIPPIPAIEAIPPIPAIPSLGWSKASWDGELKGVRPTHLTKHSLKPGML